MQLVDEQRAANQSALPWFDAFQGHREHLTALVAERTAPGSGRRLCVLGAGNCYDLDLTALTERFAEIHLVDIDEQALAGAFARQLPEVQARLVLHAPVDLSGLEDKLERWKRFEVTEGEMLEHPDVTAQAVTARLGAPFDVVVSACLITQMQLAVLHGLGESNRLFDAARHTLTLTHLKTLHALVAANGSALLVTDVLGSSSYRWLDQVPPSADFLELLKDVIAAERVMYVARPGLFHLLARQDPVLGRASVLSPPLAAWLWQNGPKLRFLVYAMELKRMAA